MIKFLKKDTILTFHQDQLERYGGKRGIRDERLLESALAQPQESFGGDYVYHDLFHMASFLWISSLPEPSILRR